MALIRYACLLLVLVCFNQKLHANQQSVSKPIPKLSVQLHSVKEELSYDFIGTLESIAGIGFKGVEFAGRFGPFQNDPQGLKQLLNKLGLEVSGVHVSINSLREEQGLKNFKFYQTIGAKIVVIPHDARINDPEQIDSLLLELNEIAMVAKSYNLKLGYHNHAKEFEAFKNSTFWQYLADHTPQDFVLQLDVGWALFAKQDPITLMKQHQNRTLTTHFKIRTYQGKPSIVAADTPVIVGENGYDWHKLVQATIKFGNTQWIVIEQEEYPEGLSPIESVHASYNGLVQATPLFISH